MENILINQISKHLSVRPVRLEKKISTLGLTLTDIENQRFLSSTDACTLVRSYAESSKVGLITKKAAYELLTALESGTNISNLKKSAPKHHKEQKAQTTIKLVQPKSTSWNLLKTCGDVVDTAINALKSHRFKFIALLIAIIVQMQHSAAWFYRLSESQHASWGTAYGYAFMVDPFILVVTLEGKLSIAKTFAVLTFFANVLYFQFWVDFDGSIQAYTNAVSCLMVSGIIAYIIYAYTEIFVKFQV